MNSAASDMMPGWGWPIVVVALVHLGLAAIPIHFSQAHGEETPTIALSMTAAPEPEPPLPPSVVPDEPMEEPVEEPEPEPEPEPESVVEANEPEETTQPSKVAIVEEIDEPEIEEENVDEPVEEEVVEKESDDVDKEPLLADIEPMPLTTPEPDVAPEPAPDPEPEPVRVDWSGYGQNVMQAVQSTQDYPRMAQRMGWEGTATVRITVGRDGRLANPPDLVDSSDHDALDKEALRMVEAAAPFETFPDDSEESEQEFIIPVRFQLTG